MRRKIIKSKIIVKHNNISNHIQSKWSKHPNSKIKINTLDKKARPNSTLSVRNELFKYKDTNRLKA